MKKVCNWWAIVYVLAVFLILPLYVENNYFNIIAAKSHAFTMISMVMIPLGIVLFIIAFFRRKLDLFKLNELDIAIIIIAGIALLSCILSKDRTASFWGSEGWRVGAFAWICLALSYLLVSRTLIYSHNIWLPVIAVNILIIFMGILQAANADVFSMHQNMHPDQIFSYFSTIGNTNWWTGYICLFAPLTVGFLLKAESTLSRVIYLIFWGFLSFAILFCATNGLILGLGVCSFFAVPGLFRNKRTIEIFGWLVLVFGLVLAVYTLLPFFAERIKAIYGMTRWICTPWAGIALFTAGTLTVVFARSFKGEIIPEVSVALIAFFETALGVCALIFIIFSVMNYSDKWGSFRGKIWNDSILLFNNFSFKEKLIGVGPDYQSSLYGWLYYWFGHAVKASHSEPLQYLLSMGVSGAMCWYGIWVSVIAGYIRERKNSIRKNILFLPLIAYFAQAHVNSSMTTNMAILFMFLAFYRMPENKMS